MYISEVSHVAATLSAPSGRPSPELLARIEAFVAGEVRRHRLPGATYAIVAGGEVIAAGGAGATAISGGTPATADTRYQTGSLTKPFTALAVLQLRDQGLIDLDAPVRRYLPWFAVADEGASAVITVRHLLNQTSGLGNGSWKVALEEPASRQSLERAVRALRSSKLQSQPGAKWAYANMNYSVLGLIVETLSGRPYTAYIEEQIFAPLGMADSTFAADTVKRGPHARPHMPKFGRLEESPIYADEPWWAPAGLSQWSSARDLGQFAAAVLGNGVERVLAPASLREAQTGAVPAGFGGVLYGLGWMCVDFHGRRLAFHPGAGAGHQSMLAVLPELNLGVVVLGGAFGQQTEQIGLDILRMLIGEEPTGGVYFPDFGKVLMPVELGMGLIGAGLLVGLGAMALFAPVSLPLWLTVLLSLLTLLLAWAPGAVRKSHMMPFPVPLYIGAGGWGIELVLAWWSFTAGVAAWAVYGLVTGAL